MGISGRAYSDARLAEMKRKNAEGITYEGRHYTGYEATQMQRQIEHSIRKTKRELIGFDKAGLKDDFMTSSIKLRRQCEYYDDFSNKAGLMKQNERAQVSGYGRRISGKAVAAEKKAYGDFINNDLSIAFPQYGPRAEYKKYLEGVRLNSRGLRLEEQALLDAVPKTGDWAKIAPGAANIDTLALLTAKTGDEFAIFAKNSVKIIAHGSAGKWDLPKDAAREIFYNQLNWTAHSHPTTLNLGVSSEDRKTLGLFTWQQKSSIIDLTGKVIRFKANMFDE